MDRDLPDPKTNRAYYAQRPKDALESLWGNPDFIGWCESCRMPLFYSDGAATDEDGVTLCGPGWVFDSDEAAAKAFEDAKAAGVTGDDTFADFMAWQEKCKSAPCFAPPEAD